MNTNPKVDWFFNKASAVGGTGSAAQWHEEYKRLRRIVLDCGLTEELKWGCPCYTFQNHNVVLIHGFKEYCALLFMKGALLKDDKQILIQQTKNVQAARQVRFTNVEDIANMESVLKQYIKEAIKLEKAGQKVALKKPSEFSMPDEFQNVLDETPALRKAFYALTPGRERGYLLYFSSAKQSKTRESRVEKYMQKILDGKGLED